MPTLAETAAAELRLKERFERQLRTDLNALNQEFLAQYQITLERDGFVRGTSDLQAATATLLGLHALRVADPFQRRLRRHLPSDLAITGIESNTISLALGDHLSSVAVFEAERITATTSRNATLAVGIARTNLAVPEGVPPSQAAVAAEARAILGRNLDGRLGVIAVNETNRPAEVAKFTEAEVLVGAEPSIRFGLGAAAFGAAGIALFGRTWQMNPPRVRPTHIAANGQRVGPGEPFIVGGARLMFPRDSSLGAPARELANCKCSSIVDVASVISARRNVVPIAA